MADKLTIEKKMPADAVQYMAPDGAIFLPHLLPIFGPFMHMGK